MVPEGVNDGHCGNHMHILLQFRCPCDSPRAKNSRVESLCWAALWGSASWQTKLVAGDWALRRRESAAVYHTHFPLLLGFAFTRGLALKKGPAKGNRKGETSPCGLASSACLSGWRMALKAHPRSISPWQCNV